MSAPAASLVEQHRQKITVTDKAAASVSRHFAVVFAEQPSACVPKHFPGAGFLDRADNSSAFVPENLVHRSALLSLGPR